MLQTMLLAINNVVVAAASLSTTREVLANERYYVSRIHVMKGYNNNNYYNCCERQRFERGDITAETDRDDLHTA